MWDYIRAPPRYQGTNCPDCKYLGQYFPYDLYICISGPNRYKTVLARYGDEGGDYLSGWTFANPKRSGKPSILALYEAKVRAVELKMLTKEDLKKEDC